MVLIRSSEMHCGVWRQSTSLGLQERLQGHHHRSGPPKGAAVVFPSREVGIGRPQFRRWISGHTANAAVPGEEGTKYHRHWFSVSIKLVTSCGQPDTVSVALLALNEKPTSWRFMKMTFPLLYSSRYVSI